MATPRQVKELEKTLSIQETGKLTFAQRLLDPLFLKKMVIFGVPTALSTGVLSFVFLMDHSLHENPELHRQLISESQAYQEGLLDMSNPWNTFNADDPASYLLSLMVGADVDLRQRLSKALQKVSPERLETLAFLFSSFELNDEQKNRFAQLLIVVMSSEKALNNIERVLDILTKFSENQGARTLLKKQGLDAEVQAPALEAGEVLEEAGEEQAEEALLLGFLDIKDPKGLGDLVEMLLELPESSYEDVMKLISGLPPKYGRFMVSLAGELSGSQTRKIVAFTDKIQPEKMPIILDRLMPLGTGKIMSTVNVLSSIPSKNLNSMIDLTSKFNRAEFESMVSLVTKTSQSDLAKLLSIGVRVNDAVFANMTIMTDKFDGGYVAKVISVASNLDASSVANMINMDKRLDLNMSKKGIDVLFQLKNKTVQADMLSEAKVLNRDNLSKSVEVMDEVKIDTVEKMVSLSKGLNKADTKNKMASQLFRVMKPSDKYVRGTVYDIREPTAVAGVRGKTGLRQAATTDVTITAAEFPYTPPQLKAESKKVKVQRVESLVDKMTLIDDNLLNEDLIQKSDELDDRGLVRGADVYINLDLGPDGKRAHRLVNTYKRADVNLRTSAIDTLRDIDASHVNAAVDIVHQADKNLMRDSIVFAERLKYRLGDEEGLRATERVINVASRVDKNKERRRGLDALNRERDVRLRRILKQVDGATEPAFLDSPQNAEAPILFNGRRINVITELYHDWDAKYPKETPTQRTPAVKMADTLSGSHGLVLGAKNGQGISRYVTQDRKLFRIAQYLDEDPVVLDNRVRLVTERPMQVPHAGTVNVDGFTTRVTETNFVIRTPEDVLAKKNLNTEAASQNSGL